MINLDQWLHEPLKNGTPRWKRIAFLVYANGGFTVRQWGIVSYGPGLHQQGLEQNDALELLQWESFIDGLQAAGVNFHDAFFPLYTGYKSAFTDSEVG